MIITDYFAMTIADNFAIYEAINLPYNLLID